MIGSMRTGVAAGIAVLLGIAGLSYVLASSAAPPGGTTAAVEFTPDGKLKQPVGYRKWVYVGEVVTPDGLNDGEATFPEFHSVYMDPESFAEYEKTGKFRDGTVLIKELSSVGSKKAPAAMATSKASSRAWRLRSRTRSYSRTSPARGPTSASATSIRSRRRRRRTPPAPSATCATRTTPRRTGSSASITPSCALRPRVGS